MVRELAAAAHSDNMGTGGLTVALVFQARNPLLVGETLPKRGTRVCFHHAVASQQREWVGEHVLDLDTWVLPPSLLLDDESLHTGTMRGAQVQSTASDTEPGL